MRLLSLVTNPAIEAEKHSFSTAPLPGACFSLVEVILMGSLCVCGWVCVYASVCLLATAMRADFGFLCTLKCDKSSTRAELEVAGRITKVLEENKKENWKENKLNCNVMRNGKKNNVSKMPKIY